MKRIVYLLLLFVFCLPNLAKAEFETKMVVTLSAIDPTKQLGQVPRSLNECVRCQLSGHTFTFPACLAGDNIEVMSGDTVVYTSVIGEDGTVTAPDDLAGEYTLVLYAGDKVYSAEVEL